MHCPTPQSLGGSETAILEGFAKGHSSKVNKVVNLHQDSSALHLKGLQKGCKMLFHKK